MGESIKKEDYQLVTSEENQPVIQDIIDNLVRGLQSASEQQNDLMKARISAFIGKLFYKYMYASDEAKRLQKLKKAKIFYSSML